MVDILRTEYGPRRKQCSPTTNHDHDYEHKLWKSHKKREQSNNNNKKF